jgi:P-type Ca2+ transporter type 2C
VSESNSVTTSLVVPHGLTQTEAARRLAESGRNELLVRRPPGVFAVVAWQLTDTVILVLLAAAVMTAIVGTAPIPR